MVFVFEIPSLSGAQWKDYHHLPCPSVLSWALYAPWTINVGKPFGASCVTSYDERQKAFQKVTSLNHLFS